MTKNTHYNWKSTYLGIKCHHLEKSPPPSLRQICSLMRGGIAERGGIRVGHRIIEINGQSVVATPHDKIIQILTNAVGEVSRNAWMDFVIFKCSGRNYDTPFSLCWQIHLKTMPASTYRLLTGQEQPVFLWALPAPSCTVLHHLIKELLP